MSRSVSSPVGPSLRAGSSFSALPSVRAGSVASSSPVKAERPRQMLPSRHSGFFGPISTEVSHPCSQQQSQKPCMPRTLVVLASSLRGFWRRAWLRGDPSADGSRVAAGGKTRHLDTAHARGLSGYSENGAPNLSKPRDKHAHERLWAQRAPPAMHQCSPFPVRIQSTLLPECALSFNRICMVGVLCPSSYFESCVCPIPSILANSACVRSKPRISRMRRPIALRSVGTFFGIRRRGRS